MLKDNRYSTGFSLIELIITITIAVILSGIVASVINMAFKAVDAVQIRKRIVIDGSIGTSKFAREFAQIINNQSITIAESKRIRFSNNQGITVEYKLVNNNLTREKISITHISPAKILCSSVDVRSSQFRYYEKDNSELTNLPLSTQDRKKVWMVELTLNLINQDQKIQYLANVFPENLKLTGAEEGEVGGLGGPPAPPPPGFGGP